MQQRVSWRRIMVRRGQGRRRLLSAGVQQRRPTLDRKAGLAFDDLLNQLWPLARLPQLRRVCDTVTERAAIGLSAARNRAGDADELGSHLIAAEPNLRVAVTTEIDELEVRG